MRRAHITVQWIVKWLVSCMMRKDFMIKRWRLSLLVRWQQPRNVWEIFFLWSRNQKRSSKRRRMAKKKKSCNLSADACVCLLASTLGLIQWISTTLYNLKLFAFTLITFDGSLLSTKNLLMIVVLIKCPMVH
ncbi:hypothetical protein BDF14DRAFT_1442763 [Spinellus fusiger]|nr:hypothetical protein BDF14DRAFT_1442763 [Spinellus fusiger]